MPCRAQSAHLPACLPRSFKKLLAKGNVAVIVGGIAEMYMQSTKAERIKLKTRKGFVKVAGEGARHAWPGGSRRRRRFVRRRGEVPPRHARREAGARIQPLIPRFGQLPPVPRRPGLEQLPPCPLLLQSRRA